MARFMTSSFSNFVSNLSEEIRKIKFKYGYNDKKCETCKFKGLQALKRPGGGRSILHHFSLSPSLCLFQKN